MSENQDLSERELEILRLVATGVSNKEIATQLYISPNTVKVHLKNIFTKIGVVSRTEAAMYAVRAGLISDKEGIQDNHLDITPNKHNPAVTEIIIFNKIVPINVLLGILIAILLVLLVGGFVLIRNSQLQQDESGVNVSGVSTGWEKRKPLPQARSAMASAIVDNHLYIIGGQTDIGVTSHTDRYDPQTDQWLSLREKPTAVRDASAIVLGGNIFIPGGKLHDESATNILEIYDPLNDSWTTGSPLPENLYAYASVAFEGKLYLFGGKNDLEYFNQSYQYDPSVDKWSPLKPLPNALAYSGAIVVNGHILLIGGFDGTSVNDEIIEYVPEENLGNKTIGILPRPLYGMGMANQADKIYIIGGLSDDVISGSLEENTSFEYSPVENTFRSIKNPINDTWSMVSVLSQGVYIYALGGDNNNQPSNQNLRYQVIYTVALPVVR